MEDRVFKKFNRPKVGMGVYILNNKDEILFTKRKGAHGEGTWCPPGGHLEYSESFSDCAIREVMEEVGIEIDNVRTIGLTNAIFDEGKHYITIAVIANYVSGEPTIKESDKITDLKWFPMKSFPNQLFLPVSNLQKTNFDCYCGSGGKFRECHGK